MADTRIEHDSFGPVDVPAARLWGAQTQRSLEHFRISNERMPAELIRALTLVKRAAATVNRELGELDAAIADAVIAAADEVLAGRHSDEFPLVVWQTGSGTQTNMNVNEVLANRASEILGGARGEGRRVHANDQVNRGQSTNDAFPTAMHVAAYEALVREVAPALRALAATLSRKSEAFAGIVKIGRTHLQDATPLTLGQEFSGYAAQLDQSILHIEAACPRLAALAIGGTAVGTGLNAPAGFGIRMAAELARLTGSPFVSAANKFESLAAHDALLNAHGTLRTAAAALTKIANDVRWLASGPRHPAGEPAAIRSAESTTGLPASAVPASPESAEDYFTRLDAAFKSLERPLATQTDAAAAGTVGVDSAGGPAQPVPTLQELLNRLPEKTRTILTPSSPSGGKSSGTDEVSEMDAIAARVLEHFARRDDLLDEIARRVALRQNPGDGR